MSFGLARVRGAAVHAFCLLLCLVTAVVPPIGVAAPAQNGISSDRLLGDSLCLQVKFAQGQSERDLHALADLHLGWVRDQIAWSDLEPRAGHYGEFPEALRSRLRYYRDHNIGVIMLLTYGNAQAYPDTVVNPHNSIDPVAYGKYVAEVSQRLTSAGVRYVIEVWNEPHNSLQPLLGGDWVGAPPSAWVDHYIRLVEEAARRVKAQNPSVRVISDDDMWIVHYHMLARGMPRTLDGVAIHPYSAGQPPEYTAITDDVEWTRPYKVVDADRSFESAVRRLRDFSLSKLGKPAGVWITEWGWAIGEKTPYGPASEDMVARFLPRALILAHASGVEATCWFSAQDMADGPMGLQDNYGRKRPAYDAYLKLAQTLGSARYLCEVKSAALLPVGRRGFLFKGGKGYILASWQAPETDMTFVDEVRYDRLNAALPCKEGRRANV